MNYALNLEPEAYDDEYADFAAKTYDGFNEFDETPEHECEACGGLTREHECEACAGQHAEYDEAELERGRPIPFRPVRNLPGMRRAAIRPGVINRLQYRGHGTTACNCPSNHCPQHGSEYVRWVQSTLNQINNLRLRVTGVMDAPTRSALRSFQQKHGLPVDGIAGPEVHDLLRRTLSNKAAPDSDQDLVESHKEFSNTNFEIWSDNEQELYNDDKKFKYHPPTKNRKYSGYSRYGGGRVDKRLRELRESGKLSISDEDIDMLQRIANVETGGLIQGINSYDSAFMSMGFMQWTIKYHKLQRFIQYASNSFRKYGIEVDATRKYKVPNEMPLAIKGATQANNLRSLDWAKRFYYAGLDSGIIIAEAKLALQIIQEDLQRIVKKVGRSFIPHYNKSPVLRALIIETYNNRPVYLVAALRNTILQTKNNQNVSTSQFLNILGGEIKNVYKLKEPEKGPQKAINLINKTARLDLRKVQHELDDTYSIEPEFSDLLSGYRKGINNAYKSIIDTSDFLRGTRIIDLTGKADKSIRKGKRDIKKVTAVVLHQMACCFKPKDPLNRFLSLKAHFAILPDGRILQFHPITDKIWASHGFNTGSVAVEFAGNFPDTKGTWWEGNKFGRNRVTQAQIEAGRYLVKYLIKTIGIRAILAHRQSTNKTNDPGPDIWYHVGQWAVDNLGLKDGGPNFKIGKGLAIPLSWRTWGKKYLTQPQELGNLEFELAFQNQEFYGD